ncbi:MAG: hypothetical protein R3302_03460 [Sulfurimonadaceae bacterium]|nr:hypothetical protein [Sulfurimonadaceae bacterium]
MNSKEEVIKALDEGKTLNNKISGVQLMMIDGKLHIRNLDRREWEPSELSFFNPPSWLNLEVISTP